MAIENIKFEIYFRFIWIQTYRIFYFSRKLFAKHHTISSQGRIFSIQISVSFGKAFLRVSRIRNIPLTWIFARVFVYVPPFIFQILEFIYWTVLIYILI